MNATRMADPSPRRGIEIFHGKPPEIARILDEMGTLLEVRGENPFRCRAYHNAAQALKGLPGDLSEMIADGSPGRGAGHRRDDARQDRPAGDDRPAARLRRAAARDAARPGRPAARARARARRRSRPCTTTLKIESLADLRAAAEAGQIAGLKGFGAKTEAKILEGIAFVESVGDRILQSTARRLVAPIFEAVRGPSAASSAPRSAAASGAGPRRSATSTSSSPPTDPAPVLDHFVALPEVAQVLAHGPTKASVRLADGVQCDLRGVEDAQFPFALHYFTGSKAHNIAMRRRAMRPGLHAQRVRPGRPRRARSPARPRPTCSPPSGWPTSRPSCARTSARSSSPSAARCPPWSSSTT